MLLLGAILLAVFALSPAWDVVVVTAAAAIEVAEIFFWVWLSKRARIQSGPETLIGARAVVVRPCSPSGQVRVQGELWQARCLGPAEVGGTVIVRGLDGLTLLVEPEGRK